MESKKKIKVIPLGGLGEVGKNITVIEYGDEIIVIDCGMTFPDTEMYGIDIVIPDVSYLVENIDKVKGFFITHGHEDHIGAIPYILKQVNVPIFATQLTAGLIESKLEEHKMLDKVSINIVKQEDIIKLDKLKVEFIRTNHSIADSCALAIHTPIGIVVHTGDFKVDFTPVDGKVIDLQRFAKLGKQGVLLLMADSTNACHPGYTMSEKSVGEKLDIPVFNMGDKESPVNIAKAGLSHAMKNNHDLVIIDTAGRLHIDETLMDELKSIKS